MEDKKPKMIYRLLGKTGLKVSVLSFGNWLTSHSPEQEKMTEDVVAKAYQLGINFFDTAEIYGFGEAEKQFGRIFAKNKWPRQSLVISTKLILCGMGVNDGGLSRKHITEGIKNSLQRLQMDYVDVLFCHRPDLNTPVEETVRAMNWVIQKGYAHYWGTSEWSAAQIQQARAVCKRLRMIEPCVEQCQYSQLWRDKMECEYEFLFKKHKLGTTIWSPLASGILTGKYNDGSIAKGGRFDSSDPMMKMIWDRYFEGEKKQATLKILNQMSTIAKEVGCTQAQLALAWAIANTDVSTAILGASKVSQIEQNVKAVEVLQKWTPELDKKINSLLANAPPPTQNYKSFGFNPNRRESSIVCAKND